MTSSSSSSSTTGAISHPSSGANGDSVAAPLFAAYASVNVKQHVPNALSLERPNYSKWQAFFTALCGKYGLLGHIDGTVAARPTDPLWSQPDACIRGWMYGSVDDTVLDLAMEPEQDARALWVSIENLFQANKESRAVVLEQEFHNLSQGDLSVDAYAQQMKRTADALREVGHTISPAQLVLNLLRGLNSRFANTADIISNTSPLPDFKSATNMLRVKELRLGTEAKTASASALAASTTSSCTSPSCQSTPSASTNRGGGGKGRSGKGKGGRGGNGGGGSSGGGRHQQQGGPGGGGRNQQHGGSFGGRQPAGPWVCYNPWAAPWPPQQQQQWGAPPAPPPQAHTAFAPPQFSAAGGPPAYGPPGHWDSASLIAALNQMAIQGGSAPWLTRDNNCSIEFDAYGFSVKDLQTKTVLLRCNSNGDLYTIPHDMPPRCHVATVSPELWHSRLGHPSPAVVNALTKLSAIQCR
ncbi:uncharacterized protein LOC105914902 [Setaria italica]|uniref:uncharacterized protein LOC105914902 n=1 Tax=Setaria italica TaxID=4555 RepID=UPI00064885CB|nr:uncharacterized protein LOC105914902 [Setaria italica]